EEVAGRLWGTDVFVDIDQGINTAVRKVRRVLRDDPEKPRYIETIKESPCSVCDRFSADWNLAPRQRRCTSIPPMPLAQNLRILGPMSCHWTCRDYAASRTSYSATRVESPYEIARSVGPADCRIQPKLQRRLNIC